MKPKATDDYHAPASMVSLLEDVEPDESSQHCWAYFWRGVAVCGFLSVGFLAERIAPIWTLVGCAVFGCSGLYGLLTGPGSLATSWHKLFLRTKLELESGRGCSDELLAEMKLHLAHLEQSHAEFVDEWQAAVKRSWWERWKRKNYASGKPRHARLEIKMAFLRSLIQSAEADTAQRKWQARCEAEKVKQAEVEAALAAEREALGEEVWAQRTSAEEVVDSVLEDFSDWHDLCDDVRAAAAAAVSAASRSAMTVSAEERVTAWNRVWTAQWTIIKRAAAAVVKATEALVHAYDRCSKLGIAYLEAGAEDLGEPEQLQWKEREKAVNDHAKSCKDADEDARRKLKALAQA